MVKDYGEKLNHSLTSLGYNTFLILFLLIFPFMLFAEDSTDHPLILTNKVGSLSVKGNVEFFLDKEGTLSLDDIPSWESAGQEDDLNFGLTHDIVWLKFSAVNNSLKEKWVLEFNIHKFYTVEIFTSLMGEKPKRSHSYSYKQPFSEREILEPYLAFPVDIPSGNEMTFILKIQSENSLEVPLLLHSSESYFLKITRMKSLYSTIYGILIAMLVYNIFIYLFLRDRNYLYYIAYVFVYAIYLSALNGYGASYLWPFIEGRGTTIFSAVFGGISLSLGCFMTREFLQTKEKLPISDKVLKILAVMGFLLSIIIFIFNRFMISFIYGNLIGTVILLSIVVITIISFLKGYKPALYFFFSYSTIIVAQIIYSLISIGPFHDHLLLRNLNQYAPVFQMVLLSLSLSYRFNLMRIEKDKAQAAVLKTEINFATGLEEKVNERTRELKEANDKLRSLSYIDSMTGLSNRRYVEKILKVEWKRHERENLSLSIIMCDIDYFKEYNDTMGHQAGDDCIQQISQALMKSGRREFDVSARYGGDEFILILPQMDSTNVVNIAQSIKSRVDSLKIPHPAYPGQFVTVSLGVSSMIPSTEKKSEMLIESADIALYKSKENGRNRITYL